MDIVPSRQINLVSPAMAPATERDNPHIVQALNLLRSRICDTGFIFKDSPDGNYRYRILLTNSLSHFNNQVTNSSIFIISKLKFMISSSVAEACNNSILLLGPRGSGKLAVCSSIFNHRSIRGLFRLCYSLFCFFRFWILFFKIC